MEIDQQLGSASPRSARERILLAAHRLFYRDGIRATGVDRIIDEAGVTKVTLYRHFPSKNDLIKAYLGYRHDLWMDWFADALARHRRTGGFALGALVSALREWFTSGDYRGCAFINAVAEFDGSLPEVVEISQRHKRDMAQAIAALLPASDKRDGLAQAAAMAVDGAIIRTQMEMSPEPALGILEAILHALCGE